MPGRPGQSKLAVFEEEIRDLVANGCSFRSIAAQMNARHGLKVTHNAVYSFVRAKRRRHRFHRSFLGGLDSDIRADLQQRLLAEWTHDSTAIEGNTLTLGETFQVLQFGLTINGKPLKDHEEVFGHAHAIDLLHEMTEARKVDADMLFDLHRAIMPRAPVDAMNPGGAWKRDYNGTTGLVDGRPAYMEYSTPMHVPALMERWLACFNDRLDGAGSRTAAIEAFVWSHTTIVRIHPFFDGNGRLARLLANLPLLRGGHPPLTVAAEQRPQYVQALWDYQHAVGRLGPDGELLPAHPALTPVSTFLASQWTKVIAMVEEARARQKRRKQP